MIIALMDGFHTGMIMMKRGITRFRGMTGARVHASALPFVASRVLPECRTFSMRLPLPMVVVMIVRVVMIMSMRGFMAMAVPMIMMLLMVMVMVMIRIVRMVVFVSRLGVMTMAVPMFVVMVVLMVVLMIMTVVVPMTVRMVMRVIRMGVMGMVIPMIVRLMVVPMPMPMVMSVMMTMAVVMMVVVVPLAFAERIGAHQPLQIDGAHSLLQGMDALVQHAGDLGFEAEIAGVGKADLRILGRQIFHLTPDTLDERAGEQVVRHDDDLHHAQRHLIAHHFLQTREGHAGEGQVHALVIADLPQPAGHACHVPVGQPVAGTAPQQDDPGGTGIRHVQLQHGLTQETLQDAQQRIADGQVRGIEELDVGMTFPGALDGARDVLANMTRGVEDERQHQHTLAVACRMVQGRIEQRIGKLDEADLDAPVGVTGTPAFRKQQDLGIAGGLA